MVNRNAKSIDAASDTSVFTTQPVMIPGRGTVEKEGTHSVHGRQNRQHCLFLSQCEKILRDCLHVVLVAGEPGSGKTQVLEDVARRAEHAGALILRGHASHAEGMPPYLPFLEALGQYMRDASPQVLREQTGMFAPVLATVFPELPLRLGTLSTSYSPPIVQERFRLYEAVGALLAAMTVSHPLLLLLEDLQWVDPATLDLLCFIAHRQPNIRVLIVGAYREGDVMERLAFENMLAELTRLRKVVLFHPEPLDMSELTDLVVRVIGSPLNLCIRTTLLEQSEGNPFFAEELVLHWSTTGMFTDANNGFDQTSLLTSSLPVSIVTTVRLRLGHLSSRTRDLLRVAARIGTTFEPALLAAVTSEPVEEIEVQLQEAVQARLLRYDCSDSLTFCSNIVRRCLVEEMGSVRRARLQAQIACLLELQQGQSDAVEHVPSVDSRSSHFTQGEQQEPHVFRSSREVASMSRVVPAAARTSSFSPSTMSAECILHDNARRQLLADGFRATRTPGEQPETPKARRLQRPAGLSVREIEVLQGVVQGKSNHEIAEELVISERTVANHLASIFNKTGVENRAAAAAFAIRHQLAE